MKVLSKNEEWRGKFLKIVNKGFINTKGKESVWECVERTNCNKVVAIFAITPEDELVMVKQYRIPVEDYVVEIPAGLADVAGESLEETAKRELQEETGFTSDKFIKLISGPFSSGMSEEEMTIFFAPNARYVGFDGVSSDDDEDIEVIKVPLDELVSFCMKKHEDFVVDIKVLATIKILEEKSLI